MIDPAQDGGAPGGMPGWPDAAPPQEAPMMQPQNPHGDEAMGEVNVKLAMDVLTHVLPLFGADTEKGASVLKALSLLGKSFGKKSQEAGDLEPAQIQALLGALPQGMGGPPPSPLMSGAGQSAPPPQMQ